MATSFNVNGMRSLQRDIDAAGGTVNDRVLATLTGSGSWPESSGSGDPASMYAIWAKAWKEEITAAHDTLAAISAGLGNVAQVLAQIDQQAATALTPPGS